MLAFVMLFFVMRLCRAGRERDRQGPKKGISGKRTLTIDLRPNRPERNRI